MTKDGGFKKGIRRHAEETVQRWPVIINDREGKSPSPTELRLGRMFHGSAPGQRLDDILANQSSGCQVLRRVWISRTERCCEGTRRSSSADRLRLVSGRVTAGRKQHLER